MTLAIPDDLHSIMKKHSEVRWSEVARKALWMQAKKMELMDKILTNSELTEEDSIMLGRKVNKSIAKKHGLLK